MKRLLIFLLLATLIISMLAACDPVAEVQETQIPKTCTDWWSCAADTQIPDDPAFANWTRTIPVSAYWWQKFTFRNAEEWRTERATILYNHLCEINGCPTVRDISAWLLWRESGGGLSEEPYSMEIIVKAIRHKFTTESYVGLGHVTYIGDGMTMADLSYFTSFINPQHDGQEFSADDWKILTRKPDQVYFDLVDYYWTDPPFPIVSKGGKIIDKWWKWGDVPPRSWKPFYTGLDVTGRKTLVFGYER